MEINSNIKIEFYFIGDWFDIKDITNAMGIEPSDTREKDSFPPEGLAHTEWSIGICAKNCNSISEPFTNLLKRLEGKEQTILSLCHKYHIRAGFNVVIHMEDGCGPEIVLIKEIISFAAAVQAEIGFDIYNDM